MAIQLGSAYGKVNIDSSGVKSGVDNAVKSMGTLEKSAQKLGVTLQNVGKAMTLAITVPLALMGKQAVMAASDFVETKNKVVVVFKDMTDAVMKWSEGSAKSMHLSQQQALEAASTFGNLFIAMKIGTKESADMSMALVQLAADLGSMNNIDPSLVLIKLKSGIVGETEAVRDLGIDLRATTVEAKAMEMGFVKVNGVFSQSALIAARYAIIMEQTKVAQGDVARTGKEFAGQLVELKAHWGDTLRILGENLLPIGKQILTQLNKWLEWFNNADPKTQKFIATLLLIAFVAGPLLFIFGKLLPLAFSGATKSMNPFSGGIFGLIGTFVKWIAIAATVVKVLTALGIATGPVGAGILAVSAAIGGAVTSFFAAVVLPLLVIIGTLALVYWAFKNNFMGITTTLQQAAFLVDVWVNNTSMAFTKWVDETAIAFTKWADETAMKFTNWVNETVKKFTNWANSVREKFNAVGTTAKQLWATFQSAFSGIGRAIDWVIAKAHDLKVALANIKLPDALTPGSPTPFEMGLRGISSAMDELSRKNFPNLQASMAYATSSNDIARAMARPVQNNSSQSTSTTMHFANGLTLNDVDRLMEQKINRFAKRALGGI